MLWGYTTSWEVTMIGTILKALLILVLLAGFINYALNA